MLDTKSAILLTVSETPTTPSEFEARVDVPSVAGTMRSTRFGLSPDALAGLLTPAQLATAMTTDTGFEAWVQSLLMHYPDAFLLVDLRAVPALHTAPWDRLTEEGPFGLGWNGSGHRPVVRFSPDLALLALVPLTLPIDVLVAEMRGWTGEPTDAFAHPLKHFRAVIANRVDGSGLRMLLRRTGHDIVHLRGMSSWRDRKPILDGGLELPVDSSGLSRLLRSGEKPARLVLIETDATSLPAMTALGHAIVGDDGPTVLITIDSAAALREFYYAITHDSTIVEAWLELKAATDNPTPLLMAHGGDVALSLRQAAVDLEVRSARQMAHVEAALGDPNVVAPTGVQETQRLTTLQVAAMRLQELRQRAYWFAHESQGLDPMTEATGELEAVVSEVDRTTAGAGRVVNTWFEDPEGGVVSPRRSVRAGATYRLSVNVGPRLRQSNVRQPAAIPEEALEPLYDDLGLELRVVVFSTDFTLDEEVAVLMLPRPPAATKPVVFTVIAPEVPGTASLRVGLYYQNNLLQSLLVTAAVIREDQGVKGRGAGNSATVEWQISNSLSDLERFGTKAVNILANETQSGTHLFAVVGTDLKEQVELGENEMKTMVSEARKALQWVCGDPELKQPYTYEPDNVGDNSRFTEYMAGLAELGYDLYVGLVTGQDDKLEARLAERLSRPSRIQVARVRSAKYGFPWSLVYDHPLVPHPTNTVCPDFLSALATGTTADNLVEHQCIAVGCAYRGDTNVVCPSGFWGFRHVIEQPLSAVRDPDQAEAQLQDAAVLIPRGQQIQVLIGYSRQLKQYSDHLTELSSLTGPAQPLSSLFDIGREMKRTDLQLVYFYCHGGNRRGKAWLGVGDRPPEEIVASNIHAWGIQWPTVRPIVFLNGCNTVGMTPDDLLTFNDQLALANAAGVLGWEITIPETLGRRVGADFVRGFLAGEPVGDLVRRMRLGLLAGFNPLGLAYTPYCLANLHLA